MMIQESRRVVILDQQVTHDAADNNLGCRGAAVSATLVIATVAIHLL